MRRKQFQKKDRKSKGERRTPFWGWGAGRGGREVSSPDEAPDTRSCCYPPCRAELQGMQWLKKVNNKNT